MLQLQQFEIPMPNGLNYGPSIVSQIGILLFYLKPETWNLKLFQGYLA
jgi:hypothetical protein